MNEVVPANCANIKALVEKTHSTSALAQLVEIYQAMGITSTKQIAIRTGKSERAVWRAKAELKECAPPDTNDRGAVINDSDASVSQTDENDRVTLTPVTVASKKERSPVPPKEKTTTPKTTVSLTTAVGAREGEIEVGHGVFVNCQTIRHAAFTISLPSLELAIAGRLPKADVKAKATAHALQWAAEIENGKRPGDVVPNKITNFLSASLMGELNREAVADVRKQKAARAHGEAAHIPSSGAKRFVQPAWEN